MLLVYRNVHRAGFIISDMEYPINMLLVNSRLSWSYKTYLDHIYVSTNPISSHSSFTDAQTMDSECSKH